MSEVGIGIPFEPCKGGTRPKGIAEFQRLLWEKYARTTVRSRVKRPAYEALFAHYLDEQAVSGISSGRWTARDGRLWFSFNDGGGTHATSMSASLHLLELGVSLTLPEWGRTFLDEGWRVTPERNALSLLTRSGALFVELRNTLYQVAPGEGAPTLTADAGAPTLAWEALTEAEKTRVQAVVDAKQCGCQLCEYFRPKLRRDAERSADRFAKTQAKDRLKAASKAQKLR